MRLLICQTQKLSYVKIVALLQREAEAVPFDLVLLPETAMEHPLQCTDQGTLSFENVGLQLLSQLAREMRFYLVLGSIEERTAKGLFETCFVLGRLGEVVMRYRKHTMGAPAEERDDGQPAAFETDFGTVGLLMGEEVKDEGRWTRLLARRPCIVLNPTNSLPQLDSSLAKAHPELQASAWHKAFHQLERQVASQTWRRPCALVRADAPLHEGGAGTSALVELHRTVLPAGWGPCFICVEVNTKGTPPSSRLPGWRQKTMEERIEEVAWNNAHCPQRRIQFGADDSEEVGPRYTVWTLPLPQAQAGVLRHNEEWRMGRRRRKSPIEALARRMASGERCFMVPILGQDDRPLCAVVSRGANMAVWDLQPKRELLASHLGEGVSVTAAGCSRNKQEFVVAGLGHGALLFRVFDYKGPSAAGVAVHLGQLPWNDWRLPVYTSEERTESVVGNANCVESVVGRGPALPEVRFLYYLEQGRLLVVLDAPDNAPIDAPETLGMLVDLETGKVRGVDMYGHAPPGRGSKPRLVGLPDGDEEVEGRWGSVHGTDTAAGHERLVAAQVIEQRLHEQPQEGPQAILVLLYDSNRLAVMTLRSFELHKQIMEENSYDRRSGDMPLSAMALPNPRSGAFHIVVSYASSVVRWWTVSLHQCRLQSHQLMSAPISQLAVCRWSSTPVASKEPVKASLIKAAEPAPPQRREAGVTTPTARSSSYGGSRQVSQLELQLLGSPKAARSPSLAGSRHESPWPLSPRSPRRLTLPKSQSTTDGGLLTRPRPSLCLPHLSRELGVGAGLGVGPSIITMSGKALLEAGHYSATHSATPRSSRFGGATSTVPGNSPQAVYLPDMEAEFGFHPMSLLLVAADTTGHLTFYIAQNGKITKVYTCPDLCPHGASRHKISQVACSERGVLVLWSNGDLRQVEFTLCEKAVSVLDIPFEA